MNDEYLKVEQPAIEQLKGMGYTHVPGDALAPAGAEATQGSFLPTEERSSLRDVVLVPRLEKALKRINPWINEQNLRKVVHDLLFPRAASLIELTKRIYDLLRESTYIVDFFDKDNEKKRVRREIKRAIMDSGLDLKRKTLNKVRDRFMELARAHFEER